MKKGIVLISAVIVIIILGILGAGYFSYIAYEKKTLDRNLALTKAFYLAEAGLDKAIATRLKASLSETLGEGSFTVNAIDLGNLVYRLQSTGQVQDSAGRVLATQTFSIYVQDTPFNKYSYLTDDEYFTLTYCWWWWCWTIQVPVWFISGDRLEGPVFTNSDFHISGSPEFYGPVGSVAEEITYMHGGPPVDNPYFDPLYSPNPELGADSIELPTFENNNIQELENNGQKFQGNTTIVFNADGTMDVTNAAKGWVNQNIEIPASKGIFVEGGNLYVSGIVNGELTMGVSESDSGQGGNVVITDNLRYNDRYDNGVLRQDPLLAEGSSDYLGLIAENNIIISKDAPQDLEVNGSMMALGDSFMVERWWDKNYNKGTLTVLGGIIQNERGPVGTFWGSTKLSGYSKNYIYDERLNEKYLPYFPTTGEYNVISWREE